MPMAPRISGIATLVTFSLNPETSTASNTPTSPVKIRRPKAALAGGDLADIAAIVEPAVSEVMPHPPAPNDAHV